MNFINLHKLKYFLTTISLSYLLMSTNMYSHTFSVKGKISTSTGPVKFASVTFIDQDDTTRKFTTRTDTSGNYSLDIITSIKPHENLPTKFELKQNYPNPFSTQTSILYKLNNQSNISVKIYNILGQVVKEFNLRTQTVGIHGVVWDGKNNLGQRVASGVYIYQLTIGNESQTKKMLYGFGNSGRGQQLLSTSGYLSKNLDETTPISLQSTAFKVRIENLGNSSPKILPEEFSNIVIEKDTTLNFEVELGIMAYSLCYLRLDTLHYPDIENWLLWTIRLNNVSGTNPKTIFKRRRNCYEPSWSPDGKYIAFTHSDSGSGDRDIYLYNTANDSIIPFLTTDTNNTFFRCFTYDSKRLIFYSSIGVSEGKYYIIDVDGKNCRLLKYPVLYLYPNDYDYLYTTQSSTKGHSVYHSNLDETINEFIVDLTEFVPTISGCVSIYDFDPNDNNLLLSFDDPSTALPNMIAKYNIDQRELDTIIVSDSGSKCYRPKYSNDFKKIAFQQVHWADTINYTNEISLLDVQTSKISILLEFPDKDESGKNQYFDSNPMTFSPDNKYLAFSKNVLQNEPDEIVWWISYLNVIEIDTKNITYIDTGILPKWNPLKPH